MKQPSGTAIGYAAHTMPSTAIAPNPTRYSRANAIATITLITEATTQTRAFEPNNDKALYELNAKPAEIPKKGMEPKVEIRSKATNGSR